MNKIVHIEAYTGQKFQGQDGNTHLNVLNSS